MSDEKPPHGLGMWQRRFVSRDELLEKYPMSDEKASPGPWRWIKVDDDSRVLRHSGSDDPYYSAVFHPDIDGMGIHISDADAALIADAWQLPQLREENRQMRELIVKLRTAFYGMSLAAFNCKPLPMDIGEADQLLLEAGAMLDKHGRAR
jgi:hypothetical protein